MKILFYAEKDNCLNLAETTDRTNANVETTTVETNKRSGWTILARKMKVPKMKLLLLLVCISLLGYTSVFAQSGGDGSPGNPWRISNMQDWTWFANSGFGIPSPVNNFRLTADIGCEDDPVTQMVVGGFAGTFDGNGRTVWVRIESVGVSVGLFSTIDENTTIRDLSVRGLINNKNYFQEYADTEK